MSVVSVVAVPSWRCFPSRFARYSLRMGGRAPPVQISFMRGLAVAVGAVASRSVVAANRAASKSMMASVRIGLATACLSFRRRGRMPVTCMPRFLSSLVLISWVW